MAEKNPIEHVLDQIADILRRTHEEIKNPSDKTVPEELFKKVKDLEKQVKNFILIQEKTIQASRIEKGEINRLILNPSSEASHRDIEILNRIKQLKNEINMAKMLFDEEVKKGEKKGEEKKKQIKKRKKKFRGFGEKDKWKKM